jgi:hypothetical protein
MSPTTPLMRRRAVLSFRSVAYIQRSMYVPVGTGDWAFAVRVFSRGHAVAHSVEALHYNPEGRGFNSRWYHRHPSGHTVTLGSTQPVHKWVPGILSGGGCKDGRCVGLITLQLSCADCLEIWEPQTPGTLRACQGL